MDHSINLQWDNLNYTVKQKTFNWRKFKSDENELKILSDGEYIQNVILKLIHHTLIPLFLVRKKIDFMNALCCIQMHCFNAVSL